MGNVDIVGSAIPFSHYALSRIGNLFVFKIVFKFEMSEIMKKGCETPSSKDSYFLYKPVIQVFCKKKKKMILQAFTMNIYAEKYEKVYLNIPTLKIQIAVYMLFVYSER